MYVNTIELEKLYLVKIQLLEFYFTSSIGVNKIYTTRKQENV
jgi:hypothetical protein